MSFLYVNMYGVLCFKAFKPTKSHTEVSYNRVHGMSKNKFIAECYFSEKVKN